MALLLEFVASGFLGGATAALAALDAATALILPNTLSTTLLTLFSPVPASLGGGAGGGGTAELVAAEELTAGVLMRSKTPASWAAASVSKFLLLLSPPAVAADPPAAESAGSTIGFSVVGWTGIKCLSLVGLDSLIVASCASCTSSEAKVISPGCCSSGAAGGGANGGIS